MLICLDKYVYTTCQVGKAARIKAYVASSKALFTKI